MRCSMRDCVEVASGESTPHSVYGSSLAGLLVGNVMPKSISHG